MQSGLNVTCYVCCSYIVYSVLVYVSQLYYSTMCNWNPQILNKGNLR